MKDKDFLIWIHERLLNVYNEPFEIDYMNKLRIVIDKLDSNQYSPNTGLSADRWEVIKTLSRVQDLKDDPICRRRI